MTCALNFGNSVSPYQYLLHPIQVPFGLCCRFYFHFSLVFSWSEYWIRSDLHPIIIICTEEKELCEWFMVTFWIVILLFRCLFYSQYNIFAWLFSKCLPVWIYTVYDDRVSVKKRRVFPPWIDYKKENKIYVLINLKKN